MLHSPNSLIIVEDEPLIALMLEELAVTLGWVVVALAHSAEEALMALEEVTPSLAILDIDLGDCTSISVAELCTTRNIPVVFITGYCPSQVPFEIRDFPVLGKPFSEDEFAEALRNAMGERMEKT